MTSLADRWPPGEYQVGIQLISPPIQTATKDDSADATQRFADVHMKRKLQTLVGMQTQEIELLRDELDRLRRRTFPTFTHLEARRAGPRDN